MQRREGVLEDVRVWESVRMRGCEGALGMQGRKGVHADAWGRG